MSSYCYSFVLASFQCALFLVFICNVAHSSNQSPRNLVRKTGEDVVFQWNSTVGILVVELRLKSNIIKTLLYYDTFMDSAAIASGYEKRVSFVGNLTTGHAWLKISNLTISDTNYYEVRIRERGGVSSGQLYLVHLRVIAKSAIQSPGNLVKKTGADAVFQWNSTVGILSVKWGLTNKNDIIKTLLYYDILISAPAIASGYEERVSFVGNLTTGHAWFKISNLTISDTNYYGAGIGERGSSQNQLYWVHLRVIDVMPHFTQVPPRILYAVLGQAVKFVWDYVTSNKTADFDVQSPRWEVYTSKGGWQTIGTDHGTSGWQWKLSSSCPVRLQNPRRVSKASTASLVIYNVTNEDTGIYRCNLTLKDRPAISSASQLIVTAQPRFTSRTKSFENIAEGKDLQLPCSAVGPPTPNITWLHVKDVTKVTISQGNGSALLSLPNIKREQSGKYECQAVNNPNQRPVTVQTVINVMYKPSIDDPKSHTTTVVSVPGARVTLRCMFSGFPDPKVRWYKPNGQPIRVNVTSYPGMSEVSLLVNYTEDSGKYKCRVENIMGYSERNITVVMYEKRDFENGHQSKTTNHSVIDPVLIVCIAIIVILAVIVLILILVIISNRRKATSGKQTRDTDGIINMAEIPVPSPNSIAHSNQSSNSLDYEQPVDEDMTSDHIDTSYPYEVPELQFIDGTSASTSQPSHYQKLNTDNTISRDYQSLQGARTAVANPSFIQSEQSNAYEPLRKNKRNHSIKN